MHQKTYGSEVYYVVNGTEIAYADKDNVLYLATKFIKHKNIDDFRLPMVDRIIGSKYETEYTELLNKYNVISEYL